MSTFSKPLVDKCIEYFKRVHHTDISVDTANTSELTAIMHKNMQVANAIAALVAFFISDFSPLMLTLRSQQELGQKRYWRMQRSFLQELLNFFIFQI